MAASTPILANNTVIKINTTDVSGDLNSVSLNITTGTVDVSVFGTNGWKNFITSISEWTMDISGFFDKATGMIDSVLYNLFGAPANPTAIEVDMPNGNTGSIKYYGNIYGKSYKTDGKPNDALKFSASMQGTGQLNRAVL